MCLESQKGSPSYNDLAARIHTTSGTNPSKQAISKKINPACVLLFQSVLARIIKTKLPKSALEILPSDRIGRVIVQDSTIIRLPNKLFECFSGVANADAIVCNARIQGVYDLLSGTFITFSIDTYSKNDLVAAPELDIKMGDLILRDRGYFTFAEVKRHLEAKADFIYRFKTRTPFFDPQTGVAIDLYDLLEKNGSLDLVVSMDKDCTVKVRLIAVPVSEEQANQRRKKAKKQASHTPSQMMLNLMSWAIFITSIPKEDADFNKILQIYGLRWRIEIIFKCWKSHMSFAKFHNVSECQLRVILTARFIMIVICMHNIYSPYYQTIQQRNKHLSLMKLLKYLMNNPEKIIEILSMQIIGTNIQKKETEDALVKYCTYDNRKRLNYNQLSFNALC
jgi:hypothetical protein